MPLLENSLRGTPCPARGDGRIYRLQAYARDLAGNQVSLGKGITFTVNRFGSVYTLQERLRAILETGYMRQEEGIVITEYSVNPVDTRITILKDNQNWRELHMEYALPDSAKRKNSFSREQKTGDGRYAVLSDKVTSGNKKGWYVKRHYISGENFKEEGTYQITLDSVGYVMEGGVRKIIKETSSTLRALPSFLRWIRRRQSYRSEDWRKNFMRERHTPL